MRLGEPTRVLLVDDNGAFREAAGACLRSGGYSVTLASNGLEALALLVQCRPDVVFADVAMPELDGYQICALVKSNSDYRHIPVIMVAGRNGLLDKERADLVRSEAYISKPFTAQALMAAVCKVNQTNLDNDAQTRELPVDTQSQG